jgi:hypothetical protein
VSWLLKSFGLIALGVFALIGLAIVGSFGFFLASREEFDFYRHAAIAMPVPERNLHFYGKYRWDGGFQPCFALTMPRTKTLSRCISSRALPHARPTYVHLIPLSATQTMVMLRLDREIVALTIDREKRIMSEQVFAYAQSRDDDNYLFAQFQISAQNRFAVLKKRTDGFWDVSE